MLQQPTKILLLKKNSTLKNNITPSTLGIEYQQKENDFNDYALTIINPTKTIHQRHWLLR